MAKHTWQKGEVITAQKMNDLEDRAGGGGLVVIWDPADTDALDKSWQEIHDAMEAGTPVTMINPSSDYDDIGVIFGCVHDTYSDNYQIYAHYWTGISFDTALFIADSADGTLARRGD